MKAKLLKKIRKRFGWYLNKNGYSILINHSTQRLEIIDPEYLRLYYKHNTLEELKESTYVTLQELSWRNLKQQTLNPFGFSVSNIWYNKALRLSRIKNRSL